MNSDRRTGLNKWNVINHRYSKLRYGGTFAATNGTGELPYESVECLL
jgi:hypothetical protein